MRDFHAFRKTAIRYWERRRIVYNITLIPPAVLAYLLQAGVAHGGDDYGLHPYYAVFLFAASALAANICYSFAYALEFLCGSDDPSSHWLRSGRTATFVAGLLVSILLALIGGRNIALMELHYR
jgi:hypothetical protein